MPPKWKKKTLPEGMQEGSMGPRTAPQAKPGALGGVLGSVRSALAGMRASKQTASPRPQAAGPVAVNPANRTAQAPQQRGMLGVYQDMMQRRQTLPPATQGVRKKKSLVKDAMSL